MAANGWRELCEAIMKEQDPKRLSDLVKELNIALDQREIELRNGSARPQILASGPTEDDPQPVE